MTAREAIDAYVRDVAAGLSARQPERADVIAELRGGLLDALEAHRRAGLADDDAVAQATAEFGDPRQVAASFRPELAARKARRCALTLAITGPATGLVWTAAAVASHVGIQRVLAWQWAGIVAVALALVGLAVTIGGVVVARAALS